MKYQCYHYRFDLFVGMEYFGVPFQNYRYIYIYIFIYLFIYLFIISQYPYIIKNLKITSPYFN